MKLREEGFEALQWDVASGTAAAVARMAARFAAGSDDLAALVRAQQDTQNQLDAVERRLLHATSAPQRDSAEENQFHLQADNLRTELKGEDDQLAAKFPSYTQLANPKPVTLTEAQQLLRPDEALIEYSVGNKKSYVGIVGHDSYTIYPLTLTFNELATAVKALRAALDPAGAMSVPAFPAGIAYQLYQKLLGPAEASLKGIKRLYLVPDAALQSLPLGVLLTAKPDSDFISDAGALRAAAWLAKDYTVTVLPSISALKALQQFAQKSPAAQAFLGIGDPLLYGHPENEGDVGAAQIAQARGVGVKAVFRGDTVNVAALRDLPWLPETAGELETEAGLFKAGPDSLLLREHATVTAVKHADLADRRVIAFATHGLIAGELGIAEPGLVASAPGQSHGRR